MTLDLEDFLEINSFGKSSQDNKRKSFFGLKSHLSQILIYSKCSETSLFVISCYVGFVVLSMHIISIIFQNWIYVVEPRAVSMTDDKGEQMANQKDFKTSCFWNPIYSGDDLSDYSFATVAILVRLLVPTLMHVIGAFICFLGFVFGIIGFVQKNGKNIFSAICYFIGGLIVSMSVLQFVSIVDDEMQPRMKLNAAGEPSSFRYSYGLPFTISALSFIPVQLCVYLQTQMFFNRYPSPDDKTKAVPGLQTLLAQARRKERFSYRTETGTSVRMPSETPSERYYFSQFRRGTRSSRDFTTYSIQRELPNSPPLTAPVFNGQNMFKY